MVPHGMAVALTAPAAFRFTFDAARTATCARPRCSPPTSSGPATSPTYLPAVLPNHARLGIPDGIGAVGYTEADVASLVEGTLKQQRLLATAPRAAAEDDVAGILTRSIELW